MIEIRKAPAPRPAVPGDVIVAKPFGGRVMTRGQIFLVTQHVVYYRCIPRVCPDCTPNQYDTNRTESHSVWRLWLDWYREDNDEDRAVREALADRDMRMWDPYAGRYVTAPADGILRRPATTTKEPGKAA